MSDTLFWSAYQPLASQNGFAPSIKSGPDVALYLGCRCFVNQAVSCLDRVHKGGLSTFVSTDCVTCSLVSAERHGLAKLPIKSAVEQNVFKQSLVLEAGVL